jgi:glycine cleavage system aminomethyltransferase T
VKRDKGDFIGRDALTAEPRQRLVCLTLEDPRSIALGSEPVRTEAGEVVGRVTSGGYGYAIGASIAFAYVPVEHAEPGTRMEIDIFGDWVRAEIRVEPLYDPKGERVRR